MSIEKIYSKRRQIRAAWDQEKIPSSELIHDMLQRTMNISPSKQNLFPFKIHAFGPKSKKEKDIIGSICTMFDTGSVNHWDDHKKDGQFNSVAGDLNVKDYVFDQKGNDLRIAPWVLVFENRLAKPNNFVKEHSELHNDWTRFTQVDPKRYRESANTKLTCIEVGMFIQTLAGLCLEKELGISYIRSFPERQWKGKSGVYTQDTNKVGKNWDELPQITEAPLMVCQIGYVAEVDDYFKSNITDPNDIHWENKPQLSEILNLKD
jgi:hypothetical protein